MTSAEALLPLRAWWWRRDAPFASDGGLLHSEFGRRMARAAHVARCESSEQETDRISLDSC